MKTLFKNSIRWAFRKFGYDIILTSHDNYPDFYPEDNEIIRDVLPYTMTSPERIFMLIKAVEYIIKNNINGDIVECGVWKGGSVMAVAKVLLKLNCLDKDIYLFDTFEGMPEPKDVDVDLQKQKATDIFVQQKISNG